MGMQAMARRHPWGPAVALYNVISLFPVLKFCSSMIIYYEYLRNMHSTFYYYYVIIISNVHIYLYCRMGSGRVYLVGMVIVVWVLVFFPVDAEGVRVQKILLRPFDELRSTLVLPYSLTPHPFHRPRCFHWNNHCHQDLSLRAGEFDDSVVPPPPLPHLLLLLL